nr:helix-turn-helix transcriptional regulator [Jingyaoa shaoxingensis]
MRMRAARNEMGLTQQRLSDMCHISIREIAKIENGEMNPSFLILKAIIQVLHNSLDSLIISDERAEQMKMLYLSCPPEMQETLLNNTKRLTEELISLSKKLEKE